MPVVRAFEARGGGHAVSIHEPPVHSDELDNRSPRRENGANNGSVHMRGRIRLATLDGSNGSSPVAASSAPVRPKQKAVRKTDIAGAGTRRRASDGISLQLLAHEVVYLRNQMLELTDREREVAFAVCAGGSNERMAERLCIALPTLRTHLMRLNQKLGTVRKGDIVRIMASKLLEAYRTGDIHVPTMSGVSQPA